MAIKTEWSVVSPAWHLYGLIKADKEAADFYCAVISHKI